MNYSIILKIMLGLAAGRWMRRFHTLGLNAELVNALKKNGISKPSQVQRLVRYYATRARFYMFRRRFH